MSLDVREPGRFSLPITILVFFGIIAALLASFGASLAALVIALVVIPIAVRMAMIRVWLAGDLLRVRNFWRSFDLAGPEVAHFAVKDAVESRALRRRMVYAELRDGETRRLSATKRAYRSVRVFAPGEEPQNEADVIAAGLNAWCEVGA